MNKQTIFRVVPVLLSSIVIVAVVAGYINSESRAQTQAGAVNVGYAAAAGVTGGAGGSSCVVVSATDSALRNCLLGGNKTVTFASDMTIIVSSPIILDAASSNMTVDASGKSVTLQVASGQHYHIIKLAREFKNGIFRNLRLVGNYLPPDSLGNGIGLFEMDGDPLNNQPNAKIALQNMTFIRDPDGAPQPWCGNKDITFEGLLVMDSFHPFGHGCLGPMPPGDGRARERITTFRSVFARNGERQPQLREGVYGYDFVKNIIYDWRNYQTSPAGYGMLFRDGSIDDVNVIGNAFLSGAWRPTWGCVFGSVPGPDKGSGGESSTEQTLRTRELYFSSDNIGGSDCGGGKMKRSQPNPRPYVLPDITLQQVLATVGAQPRTQAEQSLLNEISARLNGTPTPPPTPTPTPTSDVTPPLISNISVTNLSQSSATINWTTNEPADGQVEFPIPPCPNAVNCATPLVNLNPLTLDHTINVFGLLPATTYTYRVKSRDAAGNLAFSSNLTFTTLGISPVPTPTSGISCSVTTNDSSIESVNQKFIVSWTSQNAAHIAMNVVGNQLYTGVSKLESQPMPYSFDLGSRTNSYFTARIFAKSGTTTIAVCADNSGTSGSYEDCLQRAHTVCTTSLRAYTLAAISRNLAYGDSGEDVEKLQNFLVSQLFLSPDRVSGFFGWLTDEAVKKFQKKFDLPVTGLVGPLTRGKLQALLLGQ